MGLGVRPAHFRGDLRGGSLSQQREAQSKKLERMRSELQAESNMRIQELESRLQEQANETQRQLDIQRQDFQNQRRFLARYPPPPDQS